MAGSETSTDDAELLPSSSSSSSQRFRLLRSLRDMLFGRRRRAHGRRTSDDVATSVTRVKSSRSLSDELESTVSADRDASCLDESSTSTTNATHHK